MGACGDRGAALVVHNDKNSVYMYPLELKARGLLFERFSGTTWYLVHGSKHVKISRCRQSQIEVFCHKGTLWCTTNPMEACGGVRCLTVERGCNTVAMFLSRPAFIECRPSISETVGNCALTCTDLLPRMLSQAKPSSITVV